MSAGENGELLKKYWQLFLNEETGAMLDMQTDDSIWIVGSGPAGKVVPYFGTFHGRKGCEECFDIYERSVDPVVFEIDEYLGDADKVVVLAHEVMIAKPTGKQFESNLIYIFTVADGKIASMSATFDTAALMEAFSA